LLLYTMCKSADENSEKATFMTDFDDTYGAAIKSLSITILA
jgi:hypothetical protein